MKARLLQKKLNEKIKLVFKVNINKDKGVKVFTLQEGKINGNTVDIDSPEVIKVIKLLRNDNSKREDFFYDKNVNSY